MPQQPEKPQQPQLPNDTRTQAIGSEELPYVNEVEAALARKPRTGARGALPFIGCRPLFPHFGHLGELCRNR